MRSIQGFLFVAIASTIPVALTGCGGHAAGPSLPPSAPSGEHTGLARASYAANQKIYVLNYKNRSVWTYTMAGVRTTPTLAWMSAARGIAIDGAGKAYIVSSDNGSVTIFDKDANQLSVTITGLRAPRGIAVDAAGKIYVTNEGDNSLRTYLPDGTPTTPVITGLHDPKAVAVDSSGKIYVANAGDNTVTAYTSAGTPASPSITANLDNPDAVAVGAGGKIYVANESTPATNGTITTYNADGTPASPTITGIHSPRGIALDATGRIYVAYRNTVSWKNDFYHSGAVDVYNADGRFAEKGTRVWGALYGIALAPGGNAYVLESAEVQAYNHNWKRTYPAIYSADPYDIAVDASGKIYVAFLPSRPHGKVVQTYNPDGSESVPAISGNYFADAVGLNSNGTIFVADFYSNIVHAYTASGAASSPTISSGLNFPQDVRVDASGKIYVLNRPVTGSGYVNTYTAAGQPTTPTISSLLYANGMALGADGKIYVTLEGNGGNGSIQTYNPDGTGSTPVIGGLSYPWGVALDAAGNVYVAESGTNSIKTYTPAGVQTSPTITGLAQPTSIVIR